MLLSRLIISNYYITTIILSIIINHSNVNQIANNIKILLEILAVLIELDNINETIILI
jgi:hypothetical protein